MQVTRINANIRWGIQRGIEALYDGILTNISKEISKPEIGEEVWRHLVPPELEAKLKAVSDWVAQNQHMYVQYKGTNHIIHFAVPHFVPRQYPSESVLNLPPESAFIKLANKFHELRAELNDMIHALVPQVVLKCTNVAQLERVWPTALDYVSAELRDRIRANSEANKKTRRKKPLEEVVISDDIKAKLIRLRMLNELKSNKLYLHAS